MSTTAERIRRKSRVFAQSYTLSKPSGLPITRAPYPTPDGDQERDEPAWSMSDRKRQLIAAREKKEREEREMIRSKTLVGKMEKVWSKGQKGSLKVVARIRKVGSVRSNKAPKARTSSTGTQVFHPEEEPIVTTIIPQEDELAILLGLPSPSRPITTKPIRPPHRRAGAPRPPLPMRPPPSPPKNRSAKLQKQLSDRQTEWAKKEGPKFPAGSVEGRAYLAALKEAEMAKSLTITTKPTRPPMPQRSRTTSPGSSQMGSTPGLSPTPIAASGPKELEFETIDLGPPSHTHHHYHRLSSTASSFLPGTPLPDSKESLEKQNMVREGSGSSGSSDGSDSFQAVKRGLGRMSLGLTKTLKAVLAGEGRRKGNESEEEGEKDDEWVTVG